MIFSGIATGILDMKYCQPQKGMSSLLDERGKSADGVHPWMYKSPDGSKHLPSRISCLLPPKNVEYNRPSPPGESTLIKISEEYVSL